MSLRPAPMPKERRTSRELDEDHMTAQATLALARALEGFTERAGPALDAVAHLGDAQKRLCDFLVRRRVVILASVPAIAILIQGVSPNAARFLNALLKIWGAPV